MLKPKALKKGSRIAAVSLSWGGPGTFPHRYQAGKKQLEEAFDITLVEMPHTLADPDWLHRNPEARAADLMMAFEDNSIDGIISTIGGDDSIRLIPYIDLDIIRANPKVFCGYSDTTVSHLLCYKAGLISFYGPAIMSGFAENQGLHDYLKQSFYHSTFVPDIIGQLKPNQSGWTSESSDWSNPDNQHIARPLTPSAGWSFLQGTGKHTGHLIGGCLEVLEMLRSTPAWPTPKQWEGAILFIETSEEGPSPAVVQRALRSYAAEGVLSKLSGILFGRPGGDIAPHTFEDYDEAIVQVIKDELNLAALPIISSMDFGHTDPMMTLPIGIRVEIDCEAKTLSILENAVS
jgi:muramoyltetrapeptide carboxypeptidase LdcA involved in peptidoglycan recycling